LGTPYFLSFYLSSGLASSLTSHYARIITRNMHGSVGASGAIFGIIGMTALLHPEGSVLLFFVLPLKLALLPYAAVAFDGLGLLGLWSRIFGTNLDHAAHLGGLAFGCATTSYVFTRSDMWYWRNPNVSFQNKLEAFYKRKMQRLTNK